MIPSCATNVPLLIFCTSAALAIAQVSSSSAAVNLSVAEEEDDVYPNEQNVFLPPNLQMIISALDKLQGRQCREKGLQLLKAVKQREKWAMQMYDASPKFPVGALYGSSYNLGNFDECISVGGQYCLADVYIQPPRPYIGQRDSPNTTLHWAICVPPSCEPNDTQAFLYNIFVSVLTTNRSLSITVDDNKCHSQKNEPISTLEIVYGSLIITFLVFIVYATICDCVKEKPNEVILSFSIIQNVKKLIAVGPTSELNLNCICGIRFLSMGFIICGHSLGFLVSGPVLNAGFYKEALKKLQNGLFLNNPLLVDTFLLVSGFLMCRLLLIELEKRKGKINFIVLYIARYIRLTPSYIVMIGFYCTYLIRLDNGPLWDSRIGLERDRCVNSWWTNILYINNYVKTDSLCMFQAWYLAVDTQLFIVAPFLIYPLWKWRKFGEIVLGSVTAVAVVIPFLITYRDQLDPTLLMYANEINDLTTNIYFVNAYIKTHMRASSYFFGLLFGYLLHRLQTSDFKIPRKVIVGGSIIALFCGVISLFSINVFYTPGHEYNVLEASLYCALHRVAWCFSMGWVLIACITNPAGPVTKFLSWKAFIPLSRLTYCAYLVNGFVELYAFGILRAPIYLSISNLAAIVFSHLLITFGIAFVLCILFESPIHSLEKILIRREKSQKSNDRITQET